MRLLWKIVSCHLVSFECMPKDIFFQTIALFNIGAQKFASRSLQKQIDGLTREKYSNNVNSVSNSYVPHTLFFFYAVLLINIWLSRQNRQLCCMCLLAGACISRMAGGFRLLGLIRAASAIKYILSLFSRFYSYFFLFKLGLNIFKKLLKWKINTNEKSVLNFELNSSHLYHSVFECNESQWIYCNDQWQRALRTVHICRGEDKLLLSQVTCSL